VASKTVITFGTFDVFTSATCGCSIARRHSVIGS
jgi:hypothetical protein